MARSKTVLSSPNTIMKRCTSATRQRWACLQPVRVHVVRRDEDRRDVRQEVVEQDLLRGQRQERQQRRRDRHAHHVAEVRAGGDADVLEGVGEGAAAVLDPLPEHVQVRFQEDDIGALPRDVHGLVHRDADVGGAERRRVVDAVAEVPDRMPPGLQGVDDALLLLRVHFDEEVRLLRLLPEGLVPQARRSPRRSSSSAVSRPMLRPGGPRRSGCRR